MALPFFRLFTCFLCIRFMEKMTHKALSLTSTLVTNLAGVSVEFSEVTEPDSRMTMYDEKNGRLHCMLAFSVLGLATNVSSSDDEF